MPRMRIALVSPYSWTYPGGVTRHIEALAEQYLAAGHVVRVLSPVDPDDRDVLVAQYVQEGVGGQRLAAARTSTRSAPSASRPMPWSQRSTARAHCRPSLMPHTISDWPRRASPAANTPGTELM